MHIRCMRKACGVRIVFNKKALGEMFNYFKIELKRAFINRRMAVTLAVGILFAIIQVFVDVLPMVEVNAGNLQGLYPHSVFSKCMGMIRGSVFPAYYFMFLPILIGIPYGTVMSQDRKNGYIKNLFTRMPKRNYYIAQYVVAFLAAGVVAVVPQIINVAITALFLPSYVPLTGLGYIGIFPESLWAGIFYTHTYLYLLLYLLLDFVVYGFLSSLSLSLGWVFKYNFTVLMIPFVITQCMNVVLAFIGKNCWTIDSFACPSQPGVSTDPIEIAIVLLVLFAGAVISIIWGIKRSDELE